MRNSLVIVLLLLIVNIANAKDKTYLTEKHQEALVWFESNPNEYAFAGNRFNDSKAAIEFVKKLYKEGAIKVYVMGIRDEDWRIKSEGGPYADTLIITLPQNKKQREVLFKTHANEIATQGLSMEKDINQKELLYWWD